MSFSVTKESLCQLAIDTPLLIGCCVITTDNKLPDLPILEMTHGNGIAA